MEPTPLPPLPAGYSPNGNGHSGGGAPLWITSGGAVWAQDATRRPVGHHPAPDHEDAAEDHQDATETSSEVAPWQHRG